MKKQEMIDLCDSIANRCDMIQLQGQALLNMLDKIIAAEKAELEKSLKEN